MRHSQAMAKSNNTISELQTPKLTYGINQTGHQSVQLSGIFP
jgi:hypothetical protein